MFVREASIGLYGPEAEAASSGSTASSSTVSTCLDCYKVKSAAYTKCTEIAASDRAARTSCFDVADAILIACLQKCKQAPTSVLKTAAVIGGLALLVYKLRG